VPDDKVYLEWLEKAAKLNNPQAMDWLGQLFRGTDKAFSFFCSAANLGWKNSMGLVAEMLISGEAGGAERRRAAAVWAAQGDSGWFWILLKDARKMVASGTLPNRLCYSLGWGLYWYGGDWDRQSNSNIYTDFYARCLDYYCSCVEMQQKSIFTFLLLWKRATGVKGPGQMIARMIWDGREECLLKAVGEEPQMKRIKK
jgi:hypothetical protein